MSAEALSTPLPLIVERLIRAVPELLLLKICSPIPWTPVAAFDENAVLPAIVESVIVVVWARLTTPAPPRKVLSEVESEFALTLLFAIENVPATAWNQIAPPMNWAKLPLNSESLIESVPGLVEKRIAPPEFTVPFSKNPAR